MKLFDAHADLGYDVLDKHRQGRKNIIKTDHLEKLIQGEVFGVGMACFFKGDEDWATAKAMVSTLREEILANADRIHLTTGELWDESRINALITVEGMGFLKRDDEKTITWLYDQGVRIASLSWNDENALCTGVKGTPDRGLTLMGKQAVRIMHRLGMVERRQHERDHVAAGCQCPRVVALDPGLQGGVVVRLCPQGTERENGQWHREISGCFHSRSPSQPASSSHEACRRDSRQKGRNFPAGCAPERTVRARACVVL